MLAAGRWGGGGSDNLPWSWGSTQSPRSRWSHSLIVCRVPSPDDQEHWPGSLALRAGWDFRSRPSRVGLRSGPAEKVWTSNRPWACHSHQFISHRAPESRHGKTLGRGETGYDPKTGTCAEGGDKGLTQGSWEGTFQRRQRRIWRMGLCSEWRKHLQCHFEDAAERTTGSSGEKATVQVRGEAPHH